MKCKISIDKRRRLSKRHKHLKNIPAIRKYINTAKIDMIFLRNNYIEILVWK